MNWRNYEVLFRAVDAEVKRVELRHFFVPCVIEVHARDRLGPTVRLEMRVLDRDSGKLSVVVRERTFCADDPRQNEPQVRSVVPMLKGMIRDQLDHELREAWHVDGVRVDDPHGRT
jgi:hypothetical protein